MRCESDSLPYMHTDPQPQVIANHIMPCISFATGGDAIDYDMIGYVAKDARNAREIHVFDCGHMAHDVIATVGQVCGCDGSIRGGMICT